MAIREALPGLAKDTPLEDPSSMLLELPYEPGTCPC